MSEDTSDPHLTVCLDISADDPSDPALSVELNGKVTTFPNAGKLLKRIALVFVTLELALVVCFGDTLLGYL